MAAYAELHAHSCWSLREGASSTDELIDRALALGYPALALTDHDNLYGAMEFAKAARERHMKPITGCELTLAGRGEPGTSSHVTVLAQDIEGYRNLCRLLSRAYRTHGKDTPMVEREWLLEHNRGLILLSGCDSSELAQLATRDPKLAIQLASTCRDAFGDRFYIEAQHHDVFGDREKVAALARLAERIGVELVATNNA
ncbi:MAG TPA: PHP domain-containing protein, partial [Tepidiformaceae bacterium]|nr:PHP domain-containing protein [Tepidiformaceae bacterium]